MACGPPGALPVSRASCPVPAHKVGSIPRGLPQAVSLLHSAMWRNHVAALKRTSEQYDEYRTTLERTERSMVPPKGAAAALAAPAAPDPEGRREATGESVRRADGAAFADRGWELGAREKAVVVFVHPSGNSVFRNPSGALSKALPPQGWLFADGGEYLPTPSRSAADLAAAARELLAQSTADDVRIRESQLCASTGRAAAFCDARDPHSAVLLSAEDGRVRCLFQGERLVNVTAVAFDGVDVLTLACDGGRWCSIQVPSSRTAGVLGDLRSLCERCGVRHGVPRALAEKAAALQPSLELGSRLRRAAASKDAATLQRERCSAAQLQELAQCLDDRARHAGSMWDRFPRTPDGGAALCGGGSIRWDSEASQLLLCDRNPMTWGFGRGEHPFLAVTAEGHLAAADRAGSSCRVMLTNAVTAAERGDFTADAAPECAIRDEQLLRAACRRAEQLLRCSADIDESAPQGAGLGRRSSSWHGRAPWNRGSASATAVAWHDLMEWVGAPPVCRALLRFR
eukprot:TRINITY_DN22884_c0_g1_i1.p1 TRINITY_DN22884_c0_g1~~TRINITY_DN22884_c0_g1_i1.p1  ORF type:complete len:514 (+),score=104.50 TRINITY_DN22884_c0_g1_i1:73-1614(+)